MEDFFCDKIYYMKLFDAHTHIQFPIYDTDRDEVLSRVKAAGVRMITVGTQVVSSQAAVDLAKKYPGEIWAAAGCHPNHFASSWYHDEKEQAESEREKFNALDLLKIAQQPEVVAIGECGLDYYRLPNDEQQTTNDKNTQREAFIAQIEIAKQVQKPLMLHLRPSKGTDDAYEDALSIIHNSSFIIPPVSHFFVGSPAMAKKMLEAGLYFTFGGVITFARDYDEVIKMIPLDRIFLETDAPYVAPAPYRGKRNEPAYIIETYRKLAELKNESLEKVSGQISGNVLKVFGIHI